MNSLAGALRCEIDCIEEPDITVEGDITVDDCIDICEEHCGGPCEVAN